jgi:hypothetical protein
MMGNLEVTRWERARAWWQKTSAGDFYQKHDRNLWELGILSKLEPVEVLNMIYILLAKLSQILHWNGNFFQ